MLVSLFIVSGIVFFYRLLDDVYGFLVDMSYRVQRARVCKKHTLRKSAFDIVVDARGCLRGSSVHVDGGSSLR